MRIKLIILLVCGCAEFGVMQAQVLHNGISLSEVWPPRYSYGKGRTEMPVPYLKQKPDVIPVNTGRQLFVDSFLIAETSLVPIYHTPVMHPQNPVFRPDKEWENTTEGCPYADPFSDGIWYDESEGKFKMWYRTGAGSINKMDNQTFYTGYAESKDGIRWNKVIQDILPGTNIVDTCNRDASTTWLDKNEKDASKRYKMFNVEKRPNDKRWQYMLKYSADGVHWTNVAQSGDIYDRSTAFFNPFTNKWVLSMRHSFPESYRSRAYLEHEDPETAVSLAHRIRRGVNDKYVHFWFTPDDKEPLHPQYPEVEPGIYNFDAIAYESIFLGQYSVWLGPENEDCLKLGVQKRNEITLGYSRDGFHFSRPTHDIFFGVNETDGSWNWGNVQSVVGTPIIVGDSLYIYAGGRALNKIMWDGDTSTGLGMLRRDGFVSMQADKKEGYLLTEKMTFDGNYFFVNADVHPKKGKLYVELLDEKGNVIPGFSKQDCIVMKSNSTKQMIAWKGNDSLENLKNTPVRAKFYLTNGDLYAFWISPWETGESRGYTGGGGPGLSPRGIDIPLK